MGARLFHWGGNLDPDSPVYVRRPEDEKLLEHIQAGDFVTVLGPRQMGKTSLLYRVRKQLAEAGAAVAYVDFTPAREEALEAWYSHLASSIAEQTLGGAEAPPLPRSHLDFVSFLRSVAAGLPGRLVILLDEVGAVPADFSDAFFGNVRYVFSNRQVRPEFARTVFVLCGTFQPRDLIKNPANSPFNISKTLRMSDLSRDGVRQLVTMLERMGVPVDEEVADEVYAWTGGQPYLTQRLCSIFEDWRIPVNGPQVVERAVQEVMSDDVNLDHIVHRLQQEQELLPWLERIVVKKEAIRFNRMTNPRLARLELIGVIKAGKDGNCAVRNRIYHNLLVHHFFEGAPAVEETAPGPGVAAPERQVCTALSVDVVDSTRLKQDQDRVAVTYTFGQFFQYVQQTIRKYGGQVKDAAGDGVMCIFPTADAAVGCARDLQVNLPAFNRRHNRLSGTLQVRVGLNTGEVLARDLTDLRMTQGLYDYTLDLAGKVQKGVGPGEIALTHHTMEAITQPVSVAREEFWPEYNIRVYVLRPDDSWSLQPLFPGAVRG
ncbi:MAG TPA: AAA-like domain-containing protein [Candidatus Nitrosotenuis sp.]|nr:AAA-like domain-containing protein [Candidatus Nitrosotenuis sp.]